jgi:hypothetical protein
MGLFQSGTDSSDYSAQFSAQFSEKSGIPDLGLGTSSTEVLEREEQLSNEGGDHERFAHYVLKEKIVESAITGKAVKALCGKKWVPNRDPEKFPICPTCKEIHAGLKKPPQE